MFALCLGEPFQLVKVEVAQRLSLPWRLLQKRKPGHSPVPSLCFCGTDSPFSYQCSESCEMNARQRHCISFHRVFWDCM